MTASGSGDRARFSRLHRSRPRRSISRCMSAAGAPTAITCLTRSWSSSRPATGSRFAQAATSRCRSPDRSRRPSAANPIIWFCAPRVCWPRKPASSPGADIALEKNLPVASGIGGGSSDAAAALIACARLWNADLGRLSRHAEIAAALGADVPVCLRRAPAVMRGIGEDISAVEPCRRPGWCSPIPARRWPPKRCSARCAAGSARRWTRCRALPMPATSLAYLAHTAQRPDDAGHRTACRPSARFSANWKASPAACSRACPAAAPRVLACLPMKPPLAAAEALAGRAPRLVGDRHPTADGAHGRELLNPRNM